ncbi:MAG TPA: TAT-variant-translocated molybdopterin oxidoreductase [Holophagaceae bacterium]|nr:TAT-variant-translocated molybdopterin oxidoreductase [Holophagaceae bacterium]
MKIWKSLGQKRGTVRVTKDEFPEELPVGEGVRQLSRRDFFRWSGLGFAVSLATGCDTKKAHKALALVQGKDSFVPGTDTWYATTCAGCSAGCGILAKSRDGRPIKLEGNPEQPLGHGALCAVGQAQLRDLYDGERLEDPRIGGKAVDWPSLDADLAARFREAKAVRVLSGTLTSPTLRRAVDGFLAKFPDGRLVQYDPLSCSALAAAYERTHGQRLVPDFRLEAAELLVAVEADFLGTWINPAGFGRAYASRRNPDGAMSRHVQIESGMSLTGANADTRVRVAPSEGVAFLEHLACAVEGLAGLSAPAPLRTLEAKAKAHAQDLAENLWAAKGRSLVLCGLNDLHAQILAARLNHLLENEGRTLDLARPSLQKQGDDAAADVLLAELAAGKVDALLVLGANPAYDLPGFEAAAAKARTRVVLGPHGDETAALATHLAPDHHPLETWRDAQPVLGTWSLAQPLLSPLFRTRDAAESFAAWSGAPAPAQDLVKATWQAQVFPKAGGLVFADFWFDAVQRGFVKLETPAAAPAYREDRAATQAEWAARPAPKAAEFELLLYAKAGVLDGRHAHNPWLQELPDPVTKITWDNYAQLSPGSADRLKLKQGDLVRLRRSGAPDLVLPVVVQPGLHTRTVAVALGYGRAKAGRHGSGVGVNAWPAVAAGPVRGFQGLAVDLSPVPGSRELACTQDHHQMEGREIVRELDYETYRRDPAAARPHEHAAVASLYEPQPKGPHKWAMVIDLSKCSGCSACVISCQAENNIPTVGQDEVRRKREMHWMRIDRYYTGSEEEPGVLHQPMLCQQCDNAPCENVCPVLATVHSEEGLNQQVYNRCVGTRYCANNCPYKTRRFNWFTYDHSDPVEQLALNPDVTVRSRGVMEKCSFCIQRIQLAKVQAKNEGRELRDGELKTACQQSCPGMAILFGDLNDPDSEISKAMKDPKRYLVLGELGVLPAVSYLAKIRNGEVPGEGAHEGGAHHG